MPLFTKLPLRSLLGNTVNREDPYSFYGLCGLQLEVTTPNSA